MKMMIEQEKKYLAMIENYKISFKEDKDEIEKKDEIIKKF